MPFILILLIATLSFAQTKPKDHLSATEMEEIQKKIVGSSSGDIDVAVKLLKLDFAPFVKTLEREITTFNYRESKFLKFENGELRNKDNPKAIAYAKEWGDAAKKHVPEEKGLVGWGLYTSNNPFSSESYGEHDFSLVTLKYPTGSKMLDIRMVNEYFLPLSNVTMSYLSQLCERSFYGMTIYEEDFPYRGVSKNSLVEDPKCHQVYVKAMEQLGVTGIIYDYSFASSKMCNSSKQNGSAFVAFGSELSDRTVDLYSKLPNELNQNAKKIIKDTLPESKERKDRLKKIEMSSSDFEAYQKVATLTTAFKTHNSAPEAQFSYYMPAKDTKKKFEEEWKKELFGCDQKYENEDAPHYNPSQALKVVLEEGVLEMDLGKELNDFLKTCVGEGK